jgi:hypothetical protein
LCAGVQPSSIETLRRTISEEVEMGGKLKKLEDAGLVDPQLPKKFSDFLDGLSDDEIDTLVEIKRRLEEAGIPVDTLKPPYQSMPVL